VLHMGKLAANLTVGAVAGLVALSRSLWGIGPPWGWTKCGRLIKKMIKSASESDGARGSD